MSDQGGGDEKAKSQRSAWDVAMQFINKPTIGGALILILYGLGYLVHSHDDIRRAVIQSFTSLPNGYIVLTLLAVVVIVGIEIKRCHDDRIADRSTWNVEKSELLERMQADRAQLLAEIQHERQQAEAARDSVSEMYDHLRETFMPGGQRKTDPPLKDLTQPTR